MSEIYSINEIATKLKPVFNNSQVEKATLFGSYAKGVPLNCSDIDIAIDSLGKIKGIDFFGVLEDLTNALNLPVDLIETSQILKGSKTEKEILKTGIVIYERAN